MVRAAASGTVDYSCADPTNINWRIKHKLLLTELQRKEEQALAEHLHRHWCAYVAHGSLTEDSFKNIKSAATDTLTELQALVFPWKAKTENKEEKGTIDDETQRLVNKYKTWRAKKAEK
jgi:hypothetical protein